MNFLSIRYFLALSEKRNFTKTAIELYITQQTLSANIAALEKELGVILFTRTNPLQLTYGGEVFLKYAKELERLQSSMYDEFSDIADASKGILRIGIGHTRGQILIPLFLKEFNRIHPKTELHVLEGSNDELFQLLYEKKTDIIIARQTLQKPEIVCDDFYEEKLIMLIPDKLIDFHYPNEKKDRLEKLKSEVDFNLIEKCPFLLLSEGHFIRTIIDSLFINYNFHPKVLVEAENIHLLYEMCLSNLGITFFLESFLEKNIIDINQYFTNLGVHCIKLTNKSFRYLISIAYLKKTYQTIVMRDFIRLAKASLIFP